MKSLARQVVCLGLITFLAGVVFLSPNDIKAQMPSTANQWASWATINSNTTTTITPPFTSRNVYINNGDSTDAICVNAKGGTVDNRCNSSEGINIQIPAGQSLNLDNYRTDSITMRSIGGDASPVSVMITY